MPTSVARKILGEMLEGLVLNEAHVRDLVRVDGESLHIDFKDGSELNDSRKAAKTVRQYVSGFANADGGLLVIGVSDGGGIAAKRAFTPTSRPGNQPLHEWARNVLTPMVGGLSPPPRIQTVEVDGAEVLIVGVARAPALVPCWVDGEMRYFLRIVDSTPSVPPYLISDLVLGRRVHPQLLVTIPVHGMGAVNGAEVQFSFDVENESMVPATDVTVGVVSWASAVHPRRGRRASAVLRNFIDPVDPISGEDRMILAHVTSRANGNPLDLPAFENGTVLGVGPIVVPRNVRVDVRSALYVVASGHPPEWYQLDWTLPAPPNTGLGDATVDRILVERPMISWMPRH
jgi:hypothetical protein